MIKYFKKPSKPSFLPTNYSDIKKKFPSRCLNVEQKNDEIETYGTKDRDGIVAT